MFEAKYMDIAEKLESKIAHRQWKRRLPGVATLSRELGVNSRTVSKALRVLSDKGKIEIKPSSGAYICQGKKRDTSYGAIGVLGLLHGDKRQEELVVVEEQAKKQGYHVLSVEHGKEIFQAKPDILLNIPVDGFVFTNSTLTPNMVSDLIRAGIPFVTVNRISEVEGVNWIDFDHDTAHTNILEHIVGLGHRRIAFVTFRSCMEEHDRRMRELYRRFLEPKGLWDPILHIDNGDMQEYYRRYGEHYCSIFGMEQASYLMSMKHPPTAVVLSSHAMAYGFISQAQKMGFNIPSDVSLVASTQKRREADQETFLTMIAGSITEKVKRATDILLDLIHSPHDQPVQKFLAMDVMLRDSIGPCKP
jgi:LacI family transcriptional regulator